MRPPATFRLCGSAASEKDESTRYPAFGPLSLTVSGLPLGRAMPNCTCERKGQHPSPATVMGMLRDHDELAAKAEPQLAR